MVAFGLFLAVAALLAGIALYMSSRHATKQTAAIEKFRLSLDRMEQRIALQSSARAEASARDPRKSHGPAGGELLEAANAHYREGRFPDAVLSFRAAAAADTGGQLSDEARYRYGVSLVKTGDPNGALREFQAVVAGSPGSPYFAASAMETARLLMEKRNYARARQTLYQLLAARDRLSAADKDSVERACFLVGRCLEGEAEALEAAQSATLPVARFGPANP
jgi:TolA-binding protein